MCDTKKPEYIFYYCPRCGNMSFILNTFDHQCSICNRSMQEAPTEYQLTRENFLKDYQKFKQDEQYFFEKVVSKSLAFDIDLYNRKDEIREQKEQQMEEAMAHGRAILEGRDKGNDYGIECPYCHATNVKKISAVRRMTSAWMFGAGSGTLGKQWHCTRCKSDF